MKTETILRLLSHSIALAGVAVMAVGIWTLVLKSDYISLLSSKTYAASAYILVLAGVIVMVTGVLGCCATFREQRKMLLASCLSPLTEAPGPEHSDAVKSTFWQLRLKKLFLFSTR
ncbi:CD151 antigen [Liparis tanakae]|uniref:CD151 antigen n=1 Tax=Liparis tanakae TaxID=230148 RepID=A0A4Z2F4D5_9TELE|nr:CD151 antigen [Liparis tanakae]